MADDTPKRPRGRPPKGADKKAVGLRLRVTEEQLAAFDQAAAAEGLDLSAWARRALLIASGVIPRSGQG